VKPWDDETGSKKELYVIKGKDLNELEKIIRVWI